jgi:hypothetical protein
MAADIATSPALQVGPPRVLFTIPNVLQRINSPGSISQDGQRVVLAMMPPPAR